MERFPRGRREILAEQAARRALAGLGPGPVLPALRAVTVRELLAAPPAACDLCDALNELCGALAECVRRPRGWLYAALPRGEAMPVGVAPALAQAAVLQALRPVLAAGGRAVLELRAQPGAALLCLRGNAAPAAPSLWRQMALRGGGCAVFGQGAGLAAAARLPLQAGGRVQKSPSAQELLGDRFSLPYLFLAGYCAGPW